MSDNAEDYILRLQVTGLAEATVLNSAAATMEQQMAATEAAIAGAGDASREMAAQMKLLQSASVADASAITALNAKIGANADALNASQQAYVALGGSAQEAMSIAKSGVEGLAEAQAKLASAAQAAADAQEAIAAKAASAEEGRVSAAQATASKLAIIQAQGVSAQNAAMANLITLQYEAYAKSEEQAQAHAQKMEQIEAQGAAKIAEVTAAGAAGGTEAATEATKAQAVATEDAGEAAGGAGVNFRAMAGATRMLGGEFGGTVSKGLRLVQMFMRMGPEVGLAIAAFAIFAITIGVVIGVISKGISAAGAYRDELLKLEGATKGSVEAGKALQATITAVSSGSALARDKITDYALQLEKTKLKGAELQNALEAMSIAGSAGGDAAAQAFLKTVEAAKASGASVDALSAKMKAQLGGVAAEQALSLSVQFSKLKEDITAAFSGADLEPLLKGIHSILSLFSQTSAGGREMKASITDFVNSAIGAFLHAAIAVVKLYTAVRSNAVAWYTLKAAAIGIVALFVLFAAVVGAVIGVFVAFAAALAAPFVILIAALKANYDIVAGAWERIKSAFSAARAWLSSLSLSSIGTAIIAGLANGIRSAGTAVLAAITGVVGGAIDAAKALLHINSPSLVFHAIGEATGEGMSMGIDSSAGDVAESAGGMSSAAVTGARAGGGKAGKGDGAASKAAPSFSFTNCMFGGDVTKEKLSVWMRELYAEGALEVTANG